jgi:transposase-like protein
VEIKKYFCEDCDEAFSDIQALNRHKACQKHLDKVAGIVKIHKDPTFKPRTEANIAKKRYHCKLCDSTFPTDSKLTRHKNTQKHKDNVAKKVAKAIESGEPVQSSSTQKKLTDHFAPMRRKDESVEPIQSSSKLD